MFSANVTSPFSRTTGNVLSIAGIIRSSIGMTAGAMAMRLLMSGL